MKVDNKKLKTGVVGTIFGGSLLFTAGLGVGAAEPEPDVAGDGLVTVTQGDTAVAENVTADEAAAAVAGICGAATPDVGVLAQQVDTDGVSQTACAGTPEGVVVLAQNEVAAEPEVAPPAIEYPEPPAADESIGSTWDPI